MPVRTRHADRGTARGERIVQELLRELEAARVDRGLSFAAIGRPLGLSGQQVGRVFRGQALTLVRVAQLCELVGLELGARAFPGGQPFRDAGHLALLSRLRARLSPSLGWRVEVPVVERTGFGRMDLRAWDAVVSGGGWKIGVEAETNIRDVQALERRLALKQRDGSVAAVIVLLSETRHHREVLGDPGASLRESFPISARTTLRALASGSRPPGNSIVVL